MFLDYVVGIKTYPRSLRSGLKCIPGSHSWVLKCVSGCCRSGLKYVSGFHRYDLKYVHGSRNLGLKNVCILYVGFTIRLWMMQVLLNPMYTGGEIPTLSVFPYPTYTVTWQPFILLDFVTAHFLEVLQKEFWPLPSHPSCMMSFLALSIFFENIIFFHFTSS